MYMSTLNLTPATRAHTNDKGATNNYQVTASISQKNTFQSTEDLK